MSVVLNGQKEPQFTDAAGNFVPRPLVPPRVASPINLLNPDRYEFYTFNDDGDLVKRLMTMKEIQSIVANGDSDQQVMAKNPSGALDADANIRKIVSNVQKVLNKEMEDKSNATNKVKPTKLDTPDTSSSWSSILPAIFGNTGESITPDNAVPAVAAIGGTPDSVILSSTSKKPTTKPTTTTTKNKSKPSKRTTPRPSAAQKIRPNENRIPVKVVASNANHVLTVKRPTTASSAPTKQQSHFSSASTTPTKHNTHGAFNKYGSSSHPTKQSTAGSRPTQISTENSSLSTRKPVNVVKGTPSALNSITTTKPLQLVGTKAETIVKRPIAMNKLSANKSSTKKPLKPSSTQGIIIRKTSPTPSSVSVSSTVTHKKNKIPNATETPVTYNLFTLPAFTATPSMSTQRVRPNPSSSSSQTTQITSSSVESRISTSTPPMVTVKLISPKDQPTTQATTKKRFSSIPLTTNIEKTAPTTPLTPNTSTEGEKFDATTTEMPNLFDSDLSLNQIIEALKDTEGTTMPYAASFNNVNDLFETSTYDEQRTMQPMMNGVDSVNTDTVKVYNNGVDYTTQLNQPSESMEFKEVMNDRVTYIPQTTLHSHVMINDNSISEPSTQYSPSNAMPMRNEPASTETFINVMQHKSGSDEMELKGNPNNNGNSMENILRESFDNVLQQVQSDERTTTAAPIDSIEMSTIELLTNNDIENVTASDKKKVIFKPVPEVATEGLDKEPMTYFENVVKQLAKEKDATTVAISTELPASAAAATSIPTSTATQPASTENQTKMGPAEINTIDATTELLLSTLADRLFADAATTQSMQMDEESTLQQQETTLQQVQADEQSTSQQIEEDEQSTSHQVQVVDQSTLIDSTENFQPTGTEKLVYSTEMYSTQESQTDAEKLTTAFADETSTIDVENDQELAESNNLRLVTSTIPNNNVSTNFDFDWASTTLSDEAFTDFTSEALRRENLSMATTLVYNDQVTETTTEDTTTNYELVKLIETISKADSAHEQEKQQQQATEAKKPPNTSSPNSIERKEDSQEDKSTAANNRDEQEFSNLGETTKQTNEIDLLKSGSQARLPIKSVLTKLQNALDDISKGKLPPTLHSLKKKVTDSIKKAPTIQLDPAPKQALGLEESTVNANDDILEFTKFCNELAFDFWRVLNNDGISSARSLVLSPFALTSMLAMLFLGVRGRTSSEINDLLHLDDIVTFNPHAIFRNITESVDAKYEPNVLTSAFVREILSDRSKGKILSFYKEKVQQFYSGYVEEVNFNTVNDIIRRRTNMLVKRYTDGRVLDYLKSNNVWVRKPLAGISANIFETDCTNASKAERDGEMFFQVLPSLRQRRLVPIPAAVWKNGFTAGYDPELDATAVAIGLKENVVSTVFVMPGQQGHSAPGDNLERLESVLMANAVSKNAWRRLLATLMERPGLEVQIPRFTHRSFVNTTSALNKLGLKSLFDANDADMRGITGSTNRDMYLSDLVQINTFSTCGEDTLSEEHHVEMYPAPPNKFRTMYYEQLQARNRANAAAAATAATKSTTTTTTTMSQPIDSYDIEAQRSFSDPLFDLKYLNLPLPLRPRQARVPETPRLRFDKPFIYFVRHNPTGMVLYMGRFNPRLLP